MAFDNVSLPSSWNIIVVIVENLLAYKNKLIAKSNNLIKKKKLKISEEVINLSKDQDTKYINININIMQSIFVAKILKKTQINIIFARFHEECINIDPFNLYYNCDVRGQKALMSLLKN